MNTENLVSTAESNSTDLRTTQERLSERLSDANLDTQRFVDVENGGKACYEHEQLEYAQITGNYGIKAGTGVNNNTRRLINVDVDDYSGDLDTESLNQLPDTLSIASPHTDGVDAGHFLFAVEGPVLEGLEELTGSKNPDMPWGEVRVHNQYTVGPGSQLDGCTKEWCDDCARDGGGYYRIAQDLPIAVISSEEFINVIEADYEGSPTTDTHTESNFEGITPEVDEADFNKYDEDIINDVFAGVFDFMEAVPAKGNASQEWKDLKNRRYKQQGYVSEDGSADRSRAEFALFTLTYGIVREHAGYPKAEAIEATGQFLTYVCEEEGWTLDGQPRKWRTHTGRYRERIATKGVENYNPDVWAMWRNATGEGYGWTRYKNVVQAVRLASQDGGKYTPEDYPRSRRVRQIAQDMEENPLAFDTYKRILSEIVEDHGQVQMAYCGGNEYVYYPVEAPDPPNAEYVKANGEQREPERGTVRGDAR